MKKDIHPKIHNVVFIDTSCGAEFFATSTLKGEKKREVDGETFYEIPIEISSASHPIFTGKQMFVDTARRLEKFQEKMAKQEKASKTRKGKAVKKAARAQAKKEAK